MPGQLVQFGRYNLPNPETGEAQKWTRASRFAESLEDQYGIMKWKQRMAVKGVSSRQDMVALAQSLDPEEDKKALDDLCFQATTVAQGDRRSNLGTALHKITERYDRGEDLKNLRPELSQGLGAYIDLKRREGIQTNKSYIERVTVVPELGVAGTMDRIVMWKDSPTIADLKTGELDERGMGKIALQLALYAHGAGLYNVQTEKWERMPNRRMDVGLILHVPVGKDHGDLYEVDIAKGWQACLLAKAVRDWRNEGKKTAVLVTR